MFLDWKDQHCKNDYTTQSNLQIQCNPYQNTNGIFHRTRRKYFTICMETQKTPNSQSNLEKEKWSWGNQAAAFQTYYKATVIKTACGIGIKTAKKINETEKRIQKQTHTCVVNSFSTKVPRQITGKRKIFSTSGAKTTRYLY